MIEAFRCCNASDAPHRFAASAAARSRETLGASLGKVAISTAPVHADAVHEATHGCVLIAVGVPLIGLVAGGQPIVWHAPVERPIVEAAYAVAGPIGELWHFRRIHVADDCQIAGYAQRSVLGGGCDRCRAIRAVRRLLPDAGDETLFRVYRSVEVAVLDLIRRPAIWRAIEEIAAAAMSKHVLFGYEVEEIAVKHFQPGSFRLEIVGTTVEIREGQP